MCRDVPFSNRNNPIINLNQLPNFIYLSIYHGVTHTTKRVAQLDSKQRSRDSMTSSLTWQVYGPGVGAHNYGYNCRTLVRSVSIDS